MLDLSFCQTKLSHKSSLRLCRIAGDWSSMLPAALSRVDIKELEHKPSLNDLIVEEAAVPEGNTNREIKKNCPGLTLLYLPRNVVCIF